jgi:hypothetical protein
MKYLVAGEALGHTFDKPRTVEVGKTYGHQEVLEEVEKSKGHDRRWRCRCLNVVDGKTCGRITIKRTGELTKDTKFRACRECTDAYLRQTRQRWNRGG